MSSSYLSVTVDVEIADPPGWLLDDLRELAGLRRRGAESPTGRGSRLLTGDALEQASCGLTDAGGGRHRFDLAGLIDERQADRLERLIELLAKHAGGTQVIATVGAQYGWDGIVHGVRHGERYRATPASWVDSDGQEIVTHVPEPGAARAALLRHGAANAVLEAADDSPEGAVLSTFLLARSVARALDKHDALAALPDVLAELGAGEDEWGESTATGWRIVETADGDPTGRPLRDLAATGRAFAGSRLTGTRIELAVGAVLQVRRAHHMLLPRGFADPSADLEPGERLVVTEFRRPGVGPATGVARRDAGGQIPIREDMIGDLLDVVGS